MIEYVLEPNGFIGSEGKYRAQVTNSRSYTFDDIAAHLIKHNTGLSSSVIYGLWEGIKGAVEEFIAQGAVINTELFQTRVSIKGVFNGPEDGFDPSRHEVRLNLKPGSLLSETPKKLRAKKISPKVKTFIQSVMDVKTGAVNSCLTPGMNLRIHGHRVKISGSDPSCGLYFVSGKQTVQPVKVEFSELVVNKPSEIIAVIPRLGKGDWSLRLVTQYCPGPKPLKEPHIITFDKVLNVA